MDDMLSFNRKTPNRKVANATNIKEERLAKLQYFKRRTLELEAEGFNRVGNSIHKAATMLVNGKAFNRAGWSDSVCNTNLRYTTHVIKHVEHITALLELAVHNDESSINYTVTYYSTYSAFMYYTLPLLVKEFKLRVTYRGMDDNSSIYFKIEF